MRVTSMPSSNVTDVLEGGLHTIELGEVYYDTVSGFTGVAVSYTTYLDDPIRTVDLEAHAAGGIRHLSTFTELRIARTKANAHAGQYL